MAFDPTKPANKSKLSSAEMRDQLNGLKALNDALQQTVNSQQATIEAQQAQLDLTTGDLGALQTTVNDYIANHP